MSPYALIFGLVSAATGSALFVSISIILGTFILEDVTTVVVGVLAADGLVSIPVAIISLWIGIAVGDFALYGIGRLAVTHPRLRRYVEHEKIAPIGAWLHDKLISTVLTTRFLPGLRLPTYLACGFFSVPFKRFLIPVLIAGLVWIPLLFTASYLFGVYTIDWLGVWRWPIAAAAILTLFFIGRAHWRKRMQESKTSSQNSAH